MTIKSIAAILVASSVFVFGQTPVNKAPQRPVAEDPNMRATDGEGGGGGGHPVYPVPPVYNIQNAPGYPWQPNPNYLGNALKQNQLMYPGQYLLSNNGMYKLVFQGDGNLVIYRGSYGIGDSGTSGHLTGGFLTMQADGNLVIYDNARSGQWDSGTSNNTGINWGYYLTMQDDGNAVIYKEFGNDPAWYLSYYGQNLGVWDSNSGQHWNVH